MPAWLTFTLITSLAIREDLDRLCSEQSAKTEHRSDQRRVAP